MSSVIHGYQNATEEQILAFCESMRNSLLEARGHNAPVVVRIENDYQKEWDDPASEYGLGLAENRYMGCHYNIWVGRPASEKLAEEAKIG